MPIEGYWNTKLIHAEARDDLAKFYQRRRRMSLREALAAAEESPEVISLDSGWQKNIIVNTNGQLIAALMKSESGYSGIQRLAVGEGASNWNVEANRPTPAATVTQLVNELARTSVTVTYQTSGNADTGTITNRIKVSGRFGTGSGNGTQYERGLFGGNATNTADSGLMINYDVHGPITKDNSHEQTITIRLQYTAS